MAVLNRRTVLAAMGGVAVAPAISMSLPATVAFATDDLYPSNTAIYTDPALVEGTVVGVLELVVEAEVEVLTGEAAVVRASDATSPHDAPRTGS